MNIKSPTIVQKVNSNKTIAILLFFLPIILFRVLFIMTYPLNNTAGDEFNYYTMMLSWKSSLVHAGGYPFLFGLLFRSDFAQTFIVEHPVKFIYIILILQHCVDLASLLLIFFILSKIYNNISAGISILICGFDVWAMGFTSSTYPEWLQSALLIFAYCVAYYALISQSQFKKAILYSGSLILFTLSFLTKFNALVLILFYGFIFFLDRSSLWKKTINFIIAITIACVMVWAYLGLYHFPSTGTYSLTHDTSWILIQKISMYNTELPLDAGINTKRWIALSEVLPPSYNVAGPNMYANIDAVSMNIRIPYRDKYLYILTADESEVNKVLRENQLPVDFKLYLSGIPISYYIGLKESDDLGVNVFKEVLLYNPLNYIKHVFQLLKDFIVSPRGTPNFPINTNLLGTEASQYGAPGYCLRPVKEMGNGYIRYELIQPICMLTAPYWSTYPIIWTPGMNIFSKIWNIIPPLVVYITISFCCIVIVIKWISNKQNMTKQTGLILLMSCLIAIYFVQSSASFVIRPKEIRFVSPLIDIIFGLSLFHLMGQITSIYKHFIKTM